MINSIYLGRSVICYWSGKREAVCCKMKLKSIIFIRKTKSSRTK